MATATPPPLSVNEPSAPRHGPKHDSNEPYLRRRSSRLRSHRTPSPKGLNKVNTSSSKHSKQSYRRDLSPPSSPISPNAASPRRHPKKDTSSAGIESGLAPKPMDRMLPTPVKTPAKKDATRVTKSTSRVLFPYGLRNDPDDLVPKRNRISLDSPGSAPTIEVYTDWNARYPELDESEENIFYDTPHKRSARARARAKNMEQTEDKRKDLEENRDPEKGMWFTFRGKKVWREYEDEEDESIDSRNAAPRSQRRQATPPPKFRKTAYQPRRLFPEAHGKGDTTDEEAVTDIEHPEIHEGTHMDIMLEKPAGTPVKQHFYATPPTTARTTRSTAKRTTDGAASGVDELSTALFTVKKGTGSSSSFAEWTQVQNDGDLSSHGEKRKADQHLSPGHGKRVRSGISH